MYIQMTSRHFLKRAIEHFCFCYIVYNTKLLHSFVILFRIKFKEFYQCFYMKYSIAHTFYVLLQTLLITEIDGEEEFNRQRQKVQNVHNNIFLILCEVCLRKDKYFLEKLLLPLRIFSRFITFCDGAHVSSDRLNLQAPMPVLMIFKGKNVNRKF